MSDNTNAPATFPRQTIPNEEWSEDHYKLNVRFICNHYNKLVVPAHLKIQENIIDPPKSQEEAIKRSKTPVSTTPPLREVDQYYKLYKYVFGDQSGGNYELVTKDANNNHVRIKMMRGKDIASIFKFFNGKIREMLLPIPKIMQSVSIGGEALSRKRTKLESLKKLTDAKHFLLQQQELGVIQVSQDDEFGRLEELEEGEFRNFKEASEISFLKIAKNVYFTNRCYEQILKAGEYCFITGKMTAKVDYFENKAIIDIIPPQHSITDDSYDSDLHREATFGGSILPYSIPEVLDRWEFNEEEIKEIEAIGKNGSKDIALDWANLSWVNRDQDVPKVMVAEVRWRSVTYVNNEPVSCIRKATLIANKFLRDFGIWENSIATKDNKKIKHLGFITMTPNILNGRTMGVVGMIHEIQDLKDALVTNMIHSVTKSIGKAAYIDSSQLPEGTLPPAIISQLQQNNIFVGNRAEIDEEKAKNPLVEYIDLTLDPNINLILNQIAYWDNAMSDVLNVPKNQKLGSTDYTTTNQLQNNARITETGTRWLYDSIQMFLKEILEYSAHLVIQNASENDEDLALLVGDTMTELLSIDEVKKCLDSAYNLHLDFNNLLNEQQKASIDQMAVQKASIDPDADLHYINLIEKDTISEKKAYLKAVRKERLMREDMIRREAAANAAANTERVTRGQENIAATQTEGKLLDTEQKLQGKQEEIVLKSELEKNNQ